MLKGDIDATMMDISIQENNIQGSKIFLLDRANKKINAFSKGDGTFNV